MPTGDLQNIDQVDAAEYPRLKLRPQQTSEQVEAAEFPRINLRGLFSGRLYGEFSYRLPYGIRVVFRGEAKTQMAWLKHTWRQGVAFYKSWFDICLEEIAIGQFPDTETVAFIYAESMAPFALETPEESLSPPSPFNMNYTFGISQSVDLLADNL